MMGEGRIWRKASRIAAVLAVCLFISFVAFTQRAFAADNGTIYKDSNGWELAYSVSDEGMVAIEDVTAAGFGTLTIPAQIDGFDVTKIAAKAFYNEGGSDFTVALTSVEIPDTVTTIGASAFMGSALESVSIPASVEAIPANCFAGCAHLAAVNFEGDSIGYFGEAAFSGCTSLVRIDVPELTQTVGNETYRMGRKCFYKCTSLETVVFHGNVNTFDPVGKARSGNVNTSIVSGYYVANTDCFNTCKNLKTVVYYCKKDNIPSGTGSTSFGTGDYAGVTPYMTLTFYANAEDSKNCVNPVYSISCKATVKALDVLHGTVNPDDIWEEWGERPALSDDMTWGIQWNDEENSRVYANTMVSDTYNVIPVSKGDLAYGWVSSDAIDVYRDTVPPTGTMGSQNYPIYYVDDAKKVFGLDKLVAYLPGGIAANNSDFTIRYQKETSTTLDRATITTYTDVASPTETGYYRLRAEGKSGASAGTHTSWIIINVLTFSPTVNVYANEDNAARLGKASQAGSKAATSSAVCDVVVPASDWRYQLIGAGLAGVGNGILLFDNGKDYSSRAVTAFSQSKATALQIVGSSAIVPESASPSSEVFLMDYLNERNLQNKTRYSKDSTIQELADQVYSTIRRLQNNGNNVYGDGWGTTAIVMSPENCIDTLPIAQLAYEQKAPVFFTQPDGLLSNTDMGYLKNDGFEKVVIAGDATYVSDACASAINSQCGINPSRVLNAGSNSLEACLDFVADTEPGTSSVVIAATNNAANSVAGAMIAAKAGGVMLTCSSTADSKQIQDYLRAIMAEQGQASIETVYLVGDFANVDAGLSSRVSDMWTNPQSTVRGVGDSYEMGDYVYVVKAGNKAQCAFVRNPDLTNAVVQSFSYDGVSYTVEAPMAGAFNGSGKVISVAFKEPSISSVPAKTFAGSNLVSVDLGSKITTIGAGAFEGCKSLKQVGGSVVSKIGDRAFFGCTTLMFVPNASITSVGAYSFQGCTALNSIALPKAMSIGVSAFKGCTSLGSVSLTKATSIGSAAFQGCTSLKAIGATALTSIGASAFSGCKTLKYFNSDKVTAIGESAFEGCSQLATASFAASGLKKVGAKAFFGCSRLRSLTLKTTKLKSSNVGANAFKGMPKQTKVYVPKKKVKAYKKLFVKKGLIKKTAVRAAK